ncbi:hypothetical protein Tco_0979629, partial [Tanacetum coccineum]
AICRWRKGRNVAEESIECCSEPIYDNNDKNATQSSLGTRGTTTVKTVYLLTLELFSVQPTLCSDGTVSANNATCDKEVDRIKTVDDCMAFLLRIAYLGM